MSIMIITAGSITTAMRIKKKLNLSGIMDAEVISTPATIGNTGCSYSVRTDKRNLPLINQLVSSRQIKLRKIYTETVLSNGERVYHDIS